MGDLAESIDDLICTFENVTNTTMDTLAMIIFCWILIALFILWLGKFIYNRFILKIDQKNTSVLNSTSTSTSATTNSVTSTTPNNVSSDKIDSAVTTPGETKKLIKSVSSGKVSGSGGSGYVPPTPPVRKRLSRRSPGPELNKKPHASKPAPKCTGPDPVSVQWVNDVFQWLYNDFVVVNELLHEWILSLNEFSKKSVTEHGVGVEFMRILPETGQPTLSNVFCECDSKDDVTITCDCDATAALQLKCFRQKGEKVEISHYRVNINRFRARLNIVCISEKLLADLKCDGWPEIKINLASVGTIKNNLDETQLQDVLTEIVTTAIRNTQLHINLSQYQSCPHLTRHPIAPAQVYPVHYDGMTSTGPHMTSTPNNYGGSNHQQSTLYGDKRLLVKVIRAAQLKPSDDGSPIEPYCVVEMDEPFQKNQTSVKKNTESPIWDEHFLFDLSTNTAELLFEIYDRANKTNRFLGLGIVGVEELLINPSQRQIISLQNRPYESDNITGTLTVEFLFIEGADIPITGKPYKIKESLRTVSPTGQLITTTKTTFEGMTNGTAELTNSALQELERNKQGNNANKSTLIIHSVQRQPYERQTVKVVPQKDGSFQEVEDDDVVTNDAQEQKVPEEEKAGELQTSNMNDSSGRNDMNMSESDSEPRGRSRKKRDFFGTIRRRFGKSQTRSKSAGRSENNTNNDDAILNRSISADRSRHSNVDDGYRLSVPTLNKSLGETNSRRSSLSEASGISGASTRTYLNEASTLVLETLENGIKKHYLVPLSLAQKSRWRKKGTKLHIFNDHTFIAKHLNGGTVCQVCSKSIARRLGKQGYECRDCLIKCHKHCHVKTNDNCPQSTIHNMELSLLPVLSE
ncbi:uncharacterized protein LOC123294036 isoform X2 [Chrysoperla carnea]|uniref:uncharacterized protein LOC123294036 isoform X2 n=1 Tax=Chrysoperla carnea TaxID=189513 RepID=UPI001D08F3BD|nr:uncharacterized protein LOC123294036 isoform X2 [Chrysoperla carnea]